MTNRARYIASIRSVGVATPRSSYSQEDLLRIFEISDPAVRRLFLNNGVHRRCLTLPVAEHGSSFRKESFGELLSKHRNCSLDIGAEAILTCLDKMGATTSHIAYLCCVTTTGFLTPGLSALLCDRLSIPNSCVRLDIVGMGCNAGLNALNVTASWAASHPGALAILLCCEICSAGYVIDDSMRTAVVNSLFGDGAAAIAVRTTEKPDAGDVSILNFGSLLIPEAIAAMRYDWSDRHGMFSFFLDQKIPYVLGARIEQVVDSLLVDRKLIRSHVAHWIVHGGGKRVIDAIQINLGLCHDDLKYTRSVLSDYGNVSSASFLFSYDRLLRYGEICPGDYGVMITMGPGATIETALLQWADN